MDQSIVSKLRQHPCRRSLVSHRFFTTISSEPVSKAEAATFLGQWWHPLHYFPTFLARSLAVVPDTDTKTAISKLLFQELGEGSPERAHERIYVETMTSVGFDQSLVMHAEPFSATRALLRSYEMACDDWTTALGFIYGTEVADLAMVSGLGLAVRKATGAQKLAWVDIHSQQEPEHVKRATSAVESLSADLDVDRLVYGAQCMWNGWIAFFDELLARRAGDDARAFPLEPSVACTPQS